MRSLLSAILAVSVLAGGAQAREHARAYYTNAEGHSIHRPMHAHRAPRGASARCGDGTYSFSENHRGTCSHHGGVATWL
jgi:hypothetical protein